MIGEIILAIFVAFAKKQRFSIVPAAFDQAGVEQWSQVPSGTAQERQSRTLITRVTIPRGISARGLKTFFNCGPLGPVSKIHLV